MSHDIGHIYKKEWRTEANNVSCHMFMRKIGLKFSLLYCPCQDLELSLFWSQKKK